MKKSLTLMMMLVTVVLMDILGGAEIDLFVPSFPELQTQFNLTPFWVEALLSVNLIGFCLSLFFVGELADRCGRKPVIIVGLIIFIIGSVSCLYAPSYQFLLIGRFLQGIGVAAPATLCFLIIADFYSLKQQQYIMAILNGVINVSIGAAPVIGCYINMYFHWQGNFAALLILGIVVLLMTVFFIPTYTPVQHKQAILLREYTMIFQSKPLMLLIIQTVFMAVPYWVFVGMSPILFMTDFGVSMSHFGYYQGVWALVFAVMSVLSGWMVIKYNQRNLLGISTLFCLTTLIIIILLSIIDSRSPLLITLAFIPYSIGSVIPNTILYPICLNFIPQAKGKISAIIFGLRLIFTAIGLELAGYFYVGSFQNIGIIISACIAIGLITLYMIIRLRYYNTP